MINTVIFDMDGTLLDTLEDLADATNEGLKACGYPQRTLEEIRLFVGNGVRKLIIRALPETSSSKEIDECLDAFHKYYKVHSQDKTKPYGKMEELLKKLKEKGIHTAVLSNKFDAAVKELADYYFPGLLELAYGERDGVRTKPAPDSVFAIMEELKTNPEHTIYVGDSDVDMETAVNANVPAVGVTWGFRDRALLEEKGATYIIDQPLELLELIK